MSLLNFWVVCPYCGKNSNPLRKIDLYWNEDGYFSDEEGEEKMDVECASCGKTYTFSCEITGVKTNAEKLYADEDEEE